MIADKMKGMVANSSAIRAMFEEGTRMAAQYGAEMSMTSAWATPMCRLRLP